jgi:hypothetical protein
MGYSPTLERERAGSIGTGGGQRTGMMHLSAPSALHLPPPAQELPPVREEEGSGTTRMPLRSLTDSVVGN